jgi:2-methylcitrate dehydratase PrpD
MTDGEITRTIAELSMGYRYEAIPDEVVQMAKLAILDHVGLAIRGAREELTGILAQEVLLRQVSGRDMIPGVIRSDYLPNIAMLCGTSAHAIDYDDTLVPAQANGAVIATHVGSTVIAAVLTIATHTGASGREVLAAVIAGYEVVARVGALLHSDHYLNGFHPTASVGVFGVTAACSRLLKLSLSQTQAAFGLAATQASGLKCSFGTMAKPLNAGHCSASGLLAARLAGRGFTAPLAALEAEKGYLDMFLGLPPEKRSVEDSSVYRIFDNAFKFHAACYATHPVIEALLSLKSKFGIACEDVNSINATASTLSLKSASIGVPQTGLDCKFSFSQVAAMALVGMDTAADNTYSDEVLANRSVNSMREKVTIVEDSGIHPLDTTVTVTLDSGQIHRLTFNLVDDMTTNPTELGAKLEEKFFSVTRSELGGDQSLQIKHLILSLDSVENCTKAFRELSG